MNKQDLKKYMRNHTLIYAGCFLTVMGFGSAITLFEQTKVMVVLGVIIGSLGVLMLVCGIRDGKKLNAWLDEMETEGKLPGILQDFANAQPFFKNSMRLGDAYLFGKKVERVFTYDEVTRVYQQIHKTNGAEDGRSMFIVTQDGVATAVASMPTKGKGDEELAQAVVFILEKNPNVAVGYQP